MINFKKKRNLLCVVILLAVVLLTACSSDGENLTSDATLQMKFALNNQDLEPSIEAITEQFELKTVEVELENINDSDDKITETIAVDDLKLELDGLKSGASYDVEVKAFDENEYQVYQGQRTVTMDDALVTAEVELNLLEANNLIFEFDGLTSGVNVAEVKLNLFDNPISREVEDNKVEFGALPANSYDLEVVLSNQESINALVRVFPGRVNAAEVDLSKAEDGYLGEIDVKWQEEFTPPTIEPSLEPGRYEESQSLTLSIEDDHDDQPSLYYTTDGSEPSASEEYLYQDETITIETSTTINVLGVDETGNRARDSFSYTIGSNVVGPDRSDFRKETIYFLMTTRFYDGDPDNNVYSWACESAGNVDNNDPAWRGDFKGLVEKLDYIKALGFSAIWITPVVTNASGYDYHGYHAIDHSQVDPRYKSPGYDYQRLIDEVHARDMKIIQDIVVNHSSNFGEENLYPMFEREFPGGEDLGNGIMEDVDEAVVPGNLFDELPDDYYTRYEEGDHQRDEFQFNSRLDAMWEREHESDPDYVYNNEGWIGNWENYEVQVGTLAGDCIDFNTENPLVSDYLIDSYQNYIDMGVDAFRIDTVKHMSRLTLNREFLPAFQERGGDDFFMFGEVATRWRDVWNDGNPNISTPFYTWYGEDDDSYAWGTIEERKASVEQYWDDNLDPASQPRSDNHLLIDNEYREPDYSDFSGQSVIDFPMHWAFLDAGDAFNLAVEDDDVYNDATWNVTYVDSHDYAPDHAPEGERFNQEQSVWAENLSLMFTFRGIPTLYYGSEIEFKKGEPIDKGTNIALEDSGRAYFGDHLEGDVEVEDFGQYSNASGEMAETLAHPLAQHIRRLNLIRREIPALQMGQYTTEDIEADYGAMAYKRRYTDDEVDSFVLVTVSEDATFNNIPNGSYVDAVTGNEINVTNNSLEAEVSGQGNMRVYVLDGPGKIGEAGEYLN